ncbi:hypothetical protein ACFL20_05780 [Spirochaetota bacterium]
MRNTNSKTDDSNLTPSLWKARRSELRGFQKTYYLTKKEGDYLRVDYNQKDKRVRLYVEVSKEKGTPYYSVIHNGDIVVERCVFSGRASNYSKIFKERAKLFSSIPNPAVIKLVNKNYGISIKSDKKASSSESRREEIRRKYFKEDSNAPVSQQGEYDDIESASKLGLRDVVDFLLGIIASGAIFFFLRYNFIAAGAFASIYGMILGSIDIFIRKRAPAYFKMLFFIIVGLISYIYGYFIL